MADEHVLFSSQPTQQSSRFTYRHLNLLDTASPARESPLRVIALCDLDCFYAQVEGNRVGADPSLPLAVVQWRGLIAINYAARAAGITRHEDAESALKKCPSIKLVHVQTWKEGDTMARYHEDEVDPKTHKVSLDPYRRASRNILEIFKRHCNHVEKASIDESFLDLSSVVKATLLERYGHLLHFDSSNPDQPLPQAPFVKWSPQDGHLVPLDDQYTEEDRNDWDDVAMQIGAQFMAKVRADVKETLNYTCSAGVARNKTLAKIAAGQNKPAGQTVLRNRAVQSFLETLPFTKIRNLGGKLGVEVEKTFATSSVKDIVAIPIAELRQRLGTETGQWLWNIVRGIDYSEVSTLTQVKSMLSAKSFRPSIDSLAQAERWIRVLTADLASRLLEDPNQRRPRTLTLHHRVPGASKTRQTPIVKGPELTVDYLSQLGTKLLQQVMAEGRAFPCFNLSFGLGGFEELEAGVQDIGGFFKKVQDPIENADEKQIEPESKQSERFSDKILQLETESSAGIASSSQPPIQSDPDIHDGSFRCERCKKAITAETEEEHLDWHYARDLSRSLATEEREARPRPAVISADPKLGKAKGKRKREPEKGQMKLRFG
jgi:DNA polymerase eta